MAKIIDGKTIAAAIRAELEIQVAEFTRAGFVPGLTVVLVGDSPASQIYVKMKTRVSKALGFNAETIRLPHATSQAELITVLDRLNAQPHVHGILVQLPLPQQIDEDVVLNRIDPAKDVDGFHPVNRGRLVSGADTFVPCTPLGIQELLLRSDINPAGKHVVIVGRSNLVGLPLSALLVQKKPGANATVTVCHTGTSDLRCMTQQADILVAAIGQPQVITGDMIKVGAVVIDVGVNRVEDVSSENGYRVVGDVNFAEASKVASAITPVPGGVGPMTIAMLMRNTLKAAKAASASSSTG